MAAPIFTASDFVTALQNLLPRGRAWPRDLTALITKTLNGLAPTYARLQARDNELLVEAFPGTTEELLPEWQATLGLPDPFAPPNQSLAEAQAQVLARFVNNGGQSADFFIAYAAALGFEITIGVRPVSRFGRRFGERFGGTQWAFVWTIYVQVAYRSPNGVLARVTDDGAHLRVPDKITFSNASFEYEIRRLAPAHTIVQFVYA